MGFPAKGKPRRNVRMGGPPSKGTPKDKRLGANKGKKGKKGC
jgi:hypothetical protein